MKTARGFIQQAMIAVFVAMATVPSFAQAQEKMDAEIHTVVIEKLEFALKQAREDETVNLKPVRARLADLYAERARLRAMDEAERGCSNCKGAEEDRYRALNLYVKVINETSREKRGPLMLQMAQMHELNGDRKSSEALYERVIAEGPRQHSRVILSESYIGRAERRFSRGEMDRAQKDFESALRLAAPARKGSIMHRIAWCHLNKGEQPRAVRGLVHILQTPALLMAESEDGGDELDASFQEDVARDLATFLARGSVSAREIALLESLSPERAKKDVMKHFAGECERLGQKRAAIGAWEAFARYETNTSEHLETVVRIAQIRYELGEKKEALAKMNEAVVYWNKRGCDDADTCKTLQTRLRKIVIDWNRSEKKKPTGLLVDAYIAYLTRFDDDMEMTQWAAEAARATKRYAQAAALYHRASLIAASQPGTKGAKEILESSLVGEVEMAELSKDNKTREISYEHYLKLNPHGAIANKVRYQRARVAYERGDMPLASQRFHEFAASDACRGARSKELAALCLQSADLDLDALVGLKQHAAVQARSAEYARVYPGRRDEYLKISRTSVLKQAEIAQEPTVALAKLNEADLTGASPEERVRFLKTRLAMAERAKDLGEVRASAGMLIKTKGLSAHDREFALGKLQWAAEMAMDFDQAYTIARKMEMRSLRADERAMKLALLAELSGRNPRMHEEEFLRTSRDGFQKAFVRAKLVRAARNPMAELTKHDSALRAYPALYASVALEIFAKTGNTAFAERSLRVRGVMNQPAGRLMARELFIRDFKQVDRRLSQHRLRSQSDALMQRTLSERLQLLSAADRTANRAIGSRDWTVQLMTLNTLARENRRVYQDIMALPVPRRLKGKERENYVRLVESNARGYLHKAEQIDKKLGLLWGDYEAQKAMTADLQSAHPRVRPLLVGEVRQLAEIAPGGIRRELESELREGVQTPSQEDIEIARRQAKERPFSAGALAKWRELEVGRGRETMVAYLDARLTALKTNGEKR